MAVACRWQHVHVTTTTLSWDVVPVAKPDDVNVVIGQAHDRVASECLTLTQRHGRIIRTASDRSSLRLGMVAAKIPVKFRLIGG